MGDNLTDRLIVVITEPDNLPDQLDLKQLKEEWKGTELVHITDELEADQVSGSEYQSVLIIVHKRYSYIFLTALTMAVSRAQYEVGIIVTNYSEMSTQLSSYLSPVRKDYVLAFDRFIRNPSTNISWLEPTDTKTEPWEWWQNRLQTHFSEQGGVATQIVMSQPLIIRLQLTAAFPEFFIFPLQQPNDTNEGKKIFHQLSLR